MTRAPEYSSRLQQELGELNDEQRAAVLSGECGVVRAGPGSGKTRTLVARSAFLLETSLSRHQAIAAITYTRNAAREISDRARRFGIREASGLQCGTLHSWCLNSVVRPFGNLTNNTISDSAKIVDENDDLWVSTLQDALDEQLLPANARWEKAAITKIRREDAAGYIDEETPMVVAARRFEALLLERDLTDFDTMISTALKIVDQHPRVGQLLAVRNPWIVIDEYQDLGPVLHKLVVLLHQTHGINFTAFGDPDQTIMDFTGADPKYLASLVEEHSFRDFPLQVNYRCGSAIIAASHSALQQERNHSADPQREDAGTVEPVVAQGGLDSHADAVLERLEALKSAGAQMHEIAILYPSKGDLLDALITKLDQSDYQYVFERDSRIPDGDVIDFARRLSSRAAVGPALEQAREAGGRQIPSIDSLALHLEDLRTNTDLPRLERREILRMVAASVRLSHTWTSPLAQWLEAVDPILDLSQVSAHSHKIGEQELYRTLVDSALSNDLRLEHLATYAPQDGKCCLTTYHSAKGREWNVVLMPGLVDGITPSRRWNKSSKVFDEPTPAKLRQDRRAFYVALTRAMDSVVLIGGEYWLTPWGKPNTLGLSRFFEDIVNDLV